MKDRIDLLPNWAITNKKPAFYDTESATVIEETALLYGKIQEMIDVLNNAVEYMKTNINITTTDLFNQMLNQGQIKAKLLYDEQTESLYLVSGKEASL